MIAFILVFQLAMYILGRALPRVQLVRGESVEA